MRQDKQPKLRPVRGTDRHKRLAKDWKVCTFFKPGSAKYYMSLLSAEFYQSVQ